MMMGGMALCTSRYVSLCCANIFLAFDLAFRKFIGFAVHLYRMEDSALARKRIVVSFMVRIHQSNPII